MNLKNKAEEPTCLEQLLSIKMPRCSVCSWSWFRGADDDEDVNMNVDSSKKYYSDEYIEMKSKNFIPLPRCACTTTLLNCNLGEITTQELNHIFSSKDYIGSSTSEIMIDILIKGRNNNSKVSLSSKNIKTYPQKGMCKDCFEIFLRTSSHVIELDYLDENQPNPRFSVGEKCPCCRNRFSQRSLHSLTTTTAGSNDKWLQNREWTNSVIYTVKFIRLLKNLKKRMIAKELSQTLPSNGNIPHNNHNGETEIKINDCAVKMKEIVHDWLEDPDDHSSDECFSGEGSDDDDDDNEKNNKKVASTQKIKSFTNTKRHLSLTEGELRAELLKKDPLYRQECEDSKIIEEMMKTKEGRVKLGIESDDDKSVKAIQEKEDEELAKYLQKDLNRWSNAKDSSTKTIPQFYGSVGSSSTSTSDDDGSEYADNNYSKSGKGDPAVDISDDSISDNGTSICVTSTKDRSSNRAKNMKEKADLNNDKGYYKKSDKEEPQNIVVDIDDNSISDNDTAICRPQTKTRSNNRAENVRETAILDPEGDFIFHKDDPKNVTGHIDDGFISTNKISACVIQTKNKSNGTAKNALVTTVLDIDDNDSDSSKDYPNNDVVDIDDNNIFIKNTSACITQSKEWSNNMADQIKQDEEYAKALSNSENGYCNHPSKTTLVEKMFGRKQTNCGDGNSKIASRKRKQISSDFNKKRAKKTSLITKIKNTFSPLIPPRVKWANHKEDEVEDEVKCTVHEQGLVSHQTCDRKKEVTTIDLLFDDSDDSDEEENEIKLPSCNTGTGKEQELVKANKYCGARMSVGISTDGNVECTSQAKSVSSEEALSEEPTVKASLRDSRNSNLVDTEHLSSLVELGFEEAKSEKALLHAKNDKTLAMNILLTWNE